MDEPPPSPPPKKQRSLPEGVFRQNLCLEVLKWSCRCTASMHTEANWDHWLPAVWDDVNGRMHLRNISMRARTSCGFGLALSACSLVSSNHQWCFLVRVIRPAACSTASNDSYSCADQPKNPNRNMSGVPEWSQAEVDSVMRLYEERGRLPKWKPIADELSRLNADGQLNSVLVQKGLIRSNNAVMNKVKEILYKEQGDVPSRVRRGAMCGAWAT
jgi:hypothetical protein